LDIFQKFLARNHSAILFSLCVAGDATMSYSLQKVLERSWSVGSFSFYAEPAEPALANRRDRMVVVKAIF